jgi:hypothetical protein
MVVMLSNSILLALTLGAAPDTPPTPASPPTSYAPTFADRVDHVDVTVSDTDAVVVAFDASDSPIASLALWVDERGTTWIASDYDDGYAIVGVDPGTGEITREGDLPDAVIVERAEALAVVLDEQSPTAAKHSWGECGCLCHR